MDNRARSPFLAGLLSVFMPGLGHAYAGEAKRGIIIFIVSLIACALALLLGLIPYQPFNLASIVIIYFAVYLFAIIDAVRIARPRRHEYVLKKYNRWYVYLGAFLLTQFVITPILAGSIKSFMVQAYSIPATSMEPTLLVGDNILVNKMTYRNCEPKRGDIIVFEYPPDP
ncbi:MAG: signal peptidase I, partial [Anaerolineales bacterium]